MGLLDFFSKGKKEAKQPAASKHFQAFYDQGMIELESSDFTKAVEYFDKAIAEAEKVKDNPIEKAYSQKARALDGLGNYQESGRLYDLAFERMPDDANLWYMRGLSYADQSLYDKAAKYYEKAFELNPHLEDAMFAKAKLHEKLGQYDKQLECYQRIIQANPDSLKADQALHKVQLERKRATNSQWLGGITKGIKLREEKEEDKTGGES